jgi:hypothetical protein
MKHEGIYETLVGVFNPLSLKTLLLLYDRPYTRKEIYGECSTWNNTLVKSVLEVWKNNGVVVGGETRGDPYRLTLKGTSISEWLLEGGLAI